MITYSMFYTCMCRRCIFGQAKQLIFLALTVFTAMLDNGKTEEAWSGKKDDLGSVACKYSHLYSLRPLAAFGREREEAVFVG